MPSKAMADFLELFQEYPSQFVIPDVGLPGVSGEIRARISPGPEGGSFVVRCEDAVEGYEWWLVHCQSTTEDRYFVLVLFEHQEAIRVFLCRNIRDLREMGSLPFNPEWFAESDQVWVGDQPGYIWLDYRQNLLEDPEDTWRVYIIIPPRKRVPQWLFGRALTGEQRISFVAH